jgi:hypothetical protein
MNQWEDTPASIDCRRKEYENSQRQGSNACGCLESRKIEVTSQDHVVHATSAQLSKRDILNGWRARWGSFRMNYRVTPGLYSIGNPLADSPVLVTANYKLTFDTLRREISEVDAWILVLDTKGVNVWCAAGKGTFGTDELVRRIQVTQLGRYVSHRNLILPQLGATGVCADEVKERTGWRVKWGPVSASDIRAFLANGMRKNAQMRRVSFSMYERAVLVPYELVGFIKWIPWIAVSLAVLALPLDDEYGARLLGSLLIVFSAIITGTIAFPMLLPFLPFRAFGLKGLTLGVFVNLASVTLAYNWLRTPVLLLSALSLPSTALVVWLAMNFTGSTTFTSQTGAALELKLAFKPLIWVSAIGVALAVAYCGYKNFT